jgi:hypothetical protein
MISQRALEEAIGATGAAVVGAIAGSQVSLWGAAIGAIGGGIVGFGLGVAHADNDGRAAQHERELDRTIGVEGGDIGARRAPPAPPPAPPVDEDAWFKD